MTLAQSAVVNELLFYARSNDVSRLKSHVAKHKLNLHSTTCCDFDGRTALHLAAACGASAAVAWLLEQGAEVNCMDHFLRTPLRDAAEAGHADVQRQLIAVGGMVHFNDARFDADGSYCEDSLDAGASSVSGAAKAAGLSATAGLPGGEARAASSAKARAGLSENSVDVEDWELDPSTVEVSSQQLGVGAFGEVYTATWRGARVAVKRLKGAFSTDSAAVAEFRAELAVWCRLHHPNVCQFLGACTRGGPDGVPPTLVLECCPLGALGTLMRRHSNLGTYIKWDDAMRYALGIAAGMSYLHGRRPHAVMHRDLKPANCLLDGGNNIKLADFGLSKLLRCGPGGSSEAMLNKTFLLTGETGAYKYMAPEVFRHERYSCKCDVYAFAFICFELFEGLYRTEDPTAHAKAAAGPAAFRPPLSLLAALGTQRCAEMSNLITRCWSPEAVKRPGFDDICAELRKIRKLSEWDMVGAPPGGKRGGGGSPPTRRPSARGAPAAGAAPSESQAPGAQGGCCVIQ